MKDEDVKELYTLITDLAIKKGFNNIDLIKFLMSCLMGTMHTMKYPQEHVNMILESMKDSYRSIPESESERTD